ncbi:MAG: hypothetical protein ACXAC7_00865 [Candidatus Hodarchaeales archaeon]|jgi:predicted  nucleic acid-binding Zn-ribbon protein
MPFSFGRFKRGPDGRELFENWKLKTDNLLKDGQKLFQNFQELSERDDTSVEEFNLLQKNLSNLSNPLQEILNESFKLKHQDKDEESKIREDLEAFKDDFDFFSHELGKKVKEHNQITDFKIQIDKIQTDLEKSESELATIAKTIPRVANTGELSVYEEKFNYITKLLPNSIEKPGFPLPADLKIKIERLNFKLKEKNKMIKVIEKSFIKHSNRLVESISQAEHEQNLQKIHSWIDSIDSKFRKLNKQFTDLENEISDTSSIDGYLNLQTKLSELNHQILKLNPPEYDIRGELQTKITIEQKIKELDYLKPKIQDLQIYLSDHIDEYLADVRTSILEQYFIRSSKLTFTRVNYILGIKNDLLIKSWLQQLSHENFPLKLQGKFILLSKASIAEASYNREAFFNSILDFTKFEKLTDDISYKASMKWLKNYEKSHQR